MQVVEVGDASTVPLAHPQTAAPLLLLHTCVEGHVFIVQGSARHKH